MSTRKWTAAQSDAIERLLAIPRLCNCPLCVDAVLDGKHFEIKLEPEENTMTLHGHPRPKPRQKPGTPLVSSDVA